MGAAELSDSMEAASFARARRGSRDRSATFGDDRPITSGQIHALLVEDNPGDAELVAEFLRVDDEDSDVEMTTVGSVAKAIAALPADFDIILLDLGLPDGQGPEVLERIIEASSQIPIVVLTGLDERLVARRCLEVGAQDYVNKNDLSRGTLSRAIDFALARASSHRLARQLEHADRLNAMGQVAAAVAHEVNNPCAFILMNSTELLTRVRALCDSVSAGAPPTAEVLKNELTLIETVLLENIDGVERIARIVGDLKVFSSADQGAAETVDVVDLCRSSANMIAHHVRHQARFELDLRSVPVVVAVPQRLSQVVINLVLNAAQAISGSSDANEVRLETWQDGQEVIIAVSDTGCGIPPGARQRIFEPFYSTKSKAQGTGLGLAISVEIVRSIGGRIEVDSTVGQGSQFRVCLRVAPAANESPPPHIRLAEAESAPLRRILLIDDDESVRRAFARALSRTHTVVDVASGEEALQVLTVDREFDAILCDLMMPGLDGIDVIERLTALDPVLAGRTIILSGGAATTRMKRFVDATDIPVLAKPTSIAAINEQIARITAREDE